MYDIDAEGDERGFLKPVPWDSWDCASIQHMNLCELMRCCADNATVVGFYREFALLRPLTEFYNLGLATVRQVRCFFIVNFGKGINLKLSIL